MAITTRDLEVVRYLEKRFIVNAEILSRLVYWTKNEKSSLAIAQRRLKVLHKAKQVKRVREFSVQNYIYYLGKAPSNIKHRLAMSDFLSQLMINGFEVALEETENEYKGLEKDFGIRPDLLVTFYNGDKPHYALVEIDLTKDLTHVEGYNKFLTAREKGETTLLTKYPLALISVCKNKPEGIECVWIKPDWSNFSNLAYSFIEKK